MKILFSPANTKIIFFFLKKTDIFDCIFPALKKEELPPKLYELYTKRILLFLSKLALDPHEFDKTIRREKTIAFIVGVYFFQLLYSKINAKEDFVAITSFLVSQPLYCRQPQSVKKIFEKAMTDPYFNAHPDKEDERKNMDLFFSS